MNWVLIIHIERGRNTCPHLWNYPDMSSDGEIERAGSFVILRCGFRRRLGRVDGLVVMVVVKRSTVAQQY